ncbi:MAG: membrane protein insertase YidC [Candidatus Acidiferrales bacterium]
MAELSPEKRLLLAFVLTVLVLLGWSTMMRKLYPPPPSPPAGQTGSETGPATTTSTAEPAPAAPRLAGAKVEASPAAPLGVKQGTEERLITVDTYTATIVFSTRGAVIRSWRLKNFRDAAGEPVELVQGRVTQLGYPLALWPSAAVKPQEELQQTLSNALYVVTPETAELKAPGELLFEWSDGRLTARKRLRFPGGYRCEVASELSENGQPVAHRLAWSGGFGEHVGPAATSGPEAQILVRTPREVVRQPARVAGQTTGWLWKSASPFPYRGEAAYAGIEDQYFVALFLPQRPQLEVSAWTASWTPQGTNQPQSVGAVAVGATNGTALGLYVGPKAIDILEKIEAAALANGARPELASELVDFGWFWWVAKPLFLLMKWMYEHWIPNYGWVIVVLTVLINVALFPLRWKSMESAFKMQKVAPQIKAIQERYKQYRFNDPRKQQMQQEIMAVYKAQGINPFGGCLPLLMQIPFFYGFYMVLAFSIEMRHAPWVLWITDLSQKDPYYVLPITMAVTMFLSTRMTPMTDPQQQRMMSVMMVVFGFAFLTVASGLVLYWMVSSTVGLGQQWWINRWQRAHQQAEREAGRTGKKKKHPDETPE